VGHVSNVPELTRFNLPTCQVPPSWHVGNVPHVYTTRRPNFKPKDKPRRTNRLPDLRLPFSRFRDPLPVVLREATRPILRIRRTASYDLSRKIDAATRPVLGRPRITVACGTACRGRGGCPRGFRTACRLSSSPRFPASRVFPLTACPMGCSASRATPDGNSPPSLGTPR